MAAELKRDLELLYEMGCMRYLPRSWIQMLRADFANHAEHSFRVSMIAMYLAKREGADIGKVAQMSLVHDLPESRTGNPHYLSRQYVERKTEKAMHDILHYKEPH